MKDHSKYFFPQSESSRVTADRHMEQLKLVICYHCHAIADHLKPYCPYIKEAQFCARCGQRGHTAKECQRNPQCLHCQGVHPAHARICPIYQSKFKEIVEKAIKQSASSPEQTSMSTPQLSPQSMPDSWVFLSAAVTASLDATSSPEDFIKTLFSILKSSSPLRKVITDPITYGTDLELSNSSKEFDPIHNSTVCSGIDSIDHNSVNDLENSQFQQSSPKKEKKGEKAQVIEPATVNIKAEIIPLSSKVPALITYMCLMGIKK